MGEGKQMYMIARLMIICCLSLMGAKAHAKVPGLSGGNWKEIVPETTITFEMVAVGSANTVYAMDTGGLVYFLSGGKWRQIKDERPARYLSVGRDGSVFIVDTKHQLYQLNKKDQWEIVPGIKKLSTISVRDKDHLWGTYKNEQGAWEVWRFESGSWYRQSADEQNNPMTGLHMVRTSAKATIGATPKGDVYFHKK